MNTQLVEIQPRELKFVFEVKKQSSVAVHLANLTDQYVAFKVKTTSPKKYCVRPNVGIIKPKSICDFTVTMQAQKSLPSEMQCKDKFLIQSTVVPFGTTDDDITPGMFARDSQKYIEETKLRVILTSAPNSPVKPPADAVLRQEASHEMLKPKEPHSPVLLPVNGFIKQEPSYETSMPKDKLQNGVENLPPDDMLTKKAEAIKNVKSMEESRSVMVMESMKSNPSKDEDFYPNKSEEFYLNKNEEFYSNKNEESQHVKDLEETKFKLTKEIEELRSKMSAMGSMLVEAEHTIKKLKEEKSHAIREKETLMQELKLHSSMERGVGTATTLKTKSVGARRIQVGFPPLFVCMVALISLALGFMFQA